MKKGVKMVNNGSPLHYRLPDSTQQHPSECARAHFSRPKRKALRIANPLPRPGVVFVGGSSGAAC